MARQKKVVLTTAQEMDKVIADIEAKEEELKALKQKRKDLEKQLEQEKWDEIKKIVCDSGKSIDEIRQMFQ